MKLNVGKADKILRIVLGFALIILALMGGVAGTTALFVAAIGVILAVTALLNFCPLYGVCGISTRPGSQENE
jgi:hypothetical protein